MAPKVIYVGGPQGAGKTHVVGEVARRLRSEGVTHLHVGELSREYATFLGKKPAELDRAECANFRLLMMNAVRHAPGRVVLVDDHFAFPKEAFPPSFSGKHDFTQGFTRRTLEKHIAHLVLINARPHVAFERRQNDPAKPRFGTREDAAREVVAERFVAYRFAAKTKKPLSIINNEGNPQDAIDELEAIVRRHL